MANTYHLVRAKLNPKDEFYTPLDLIKSELDNYATYFKDKVIYLNCDNYKYSNFFKYFYDNFEKFGIKKLICTYYDEEKISIGVIVEKDKKIKTFNLRQNGDFRSDESINFLKESDIVITNPPFSLARDYFNLLFKYKKDFITLASLNVLTYKGMFSKIMENRLGIGYGFNIKGYFVVPKSYKTYDRLNEKGEKTVRIANITWYTSFDVKTKRDFLPLTKSYNEKDYPKYDNVDAINVDKLENIPNNYYEVMGVPITILGKYNPKQFEILASSKEKGTKYFGDLYVKGKGVYARIFIKRKG